MSPDVRRAVLGVTGIDYGNLLLARSTDFTSFSQFLGIYYRDPSLYPVILDLLDQLWDRGDPDGYAPYMTSHPLPDTPTHQVLMQIAYGDFQVSMYAGAAEARTIGVSAYQPALDPDRSRDRNLFYGIPAIRHFPFRGSAIEIWDSGPGRVQPPPVGNIPPTAGPTNIDPHENPRNTPAAQQQISDFLRAERRGDRRVRRLAVSLVGVHTVVTHVPCWIFPAWRGKSSTRLTADTSGVAARHPWAPGATPMAPRRPDRR